MRAMVYSWSKLIRQFQDQVWKRAQAWVEVTGLVLGCFPTEIFLVLIVTVFPQNDVVEKNFRTAIT